MIIKIITDYSNEQNPVLALRPESAAEWAQYREIIEVLKQKNVFFNENMLFDTDTLNIWLKKK